jgi:hypothetical protein
MENFAGVTGKGFSDFLAETLSEKTKGLSANSVVSWEG